MPLSDDQRAMLRLLAQREQGYEDIAALMGLSVDEVRERVRGALDQLQAEGKDPPEVPRPAEPRVTPEPTASGPGMAPEPTAPEPKPAPEEPMPAEPVAPASAATHPPARSHADAAASTPPTPAPKREKDKGLSIAIAAGVAGAIVIVVLAVLLITNSGGDDSPETTSGANTGNTAAEQTAGDGDAAAAKEPTEAVLEPVGGSGASGTATFGRVRNSLALGIEVEGLEPSDGENDSYAIWLAQSPQRMLPLAATPAPKGKIDASFEVPVEVLAYLANETFRQIVITKTDNQLLQTALARATKEKKAPSYTGETVAEGTVVGPIVGAELRERGE